MKVHAYFPVRDQYQKNAKSALKIENIRTSVFFYLAADSTDENG